MPVHYFQVRDCALDPLTPVLELVKRHPDTPNLTTSTVCLLYVSLYTELIPAMARHTELVVRQNRPQPHFCSLSGPIYTYTECIMLSA